MTAAICEKPSAWFAIGVPSSAFSGNCALPNCCAATVTGSDSSARANAIRAIMSAALSISAGAVDEIVEGFAAFEALNPGDQLGGEGRGRDVASVMRRNRDARMSPQRALRRQRLMGKHVERRAGQGALVERHQDVGV